MDTHGQALSLIEDKARCLSIAGELRCMTTMGMQASVVQTHTHGQLVVQVDIVND